MTTASHNRMAIAVLAGLALACACPLTSAVPVQSGTILNFDIGPLGGLDGDGGLPQTSYTSVDYNGDGNADVWNRMGQTPGGVPFGGIQDINGNELDATVTFRADGVANRDGNNLNAGWANAQDVPTAVMDTWYFKGAGTMTLTISGLNTDLRYNVELFNAFDSWAGTGNVSDMTVNGLFADGTAGPSTAADGDNWNRYSDGFVGKSGLLFSNVSATSGSLVVSAFTGGNPTVQAIRITAQVPEPTTVVLCGLAGLAVLTRRRRIA
jgi:hypothetical protein